MIYLLIGILMLAAIAILLLIIFVLAAWLQGSLAIAFPGLGFIMGSGIFFIILIIFEIVIIVITAYMIRYVRSQVVS